MHRVPESLPMVPIGDLSRCPRGVLDRVAAGERLIVSRHGKPVATLQPLDGYVFQPFEGTAHDVFGWPIGGIEDEIAKLSPAQQALLGGCYRDWRLRPVRLPEHLWSEGMRSLGDLHIRGLARKTFRGWELTGRGLAMHEALRGRYGGDQTLPSLAYRKERRSQSSG